MGAEQRAPPARDAEAGEPAAATAPATPETVVSVRGLWKIFGEREAEALQAIRRHDLSNN